MFAQLRAELQKFFFLTTVFVTILITRVKAEYCGQEELARCSRSLEMLQSSSELSFVSNKEELDRLCPGLKNDTHCIRSYTRRCMTLQQRNQFAKLYHGTYQVVRDLCSVGTYQDEFLRHAPCLQRVQPEYEVCAKRYQHTMASISNQQQEQIIDSNDINAVKEREMMENDHVRTVCCAFREYLSCSENTARKSCGVETAAFTRGFLDRMSSSLISTYCESYFNGENKCPIEVTSSAPSKQQTTWTIALLSIAITYFRYI